MPRAEFSVLLGQGNGWVAVGITELLRFLPEKHPRRARISASYRKMIASLWEYQDADGMWHKLIDWPDSCRETSCTAMFAYAMIAGVKRGWLSEKCYVQAARKGWLALTDYIDADGNVDRVCVGAGQKNDRKYYLDRPRISTGLARRAITTARRRPCGAWLL